MREITTHPRETAEAAAQFASDVQYYLTLRPKQLPSRYLYDALGSALFEAICHLPWYGITRAEMRLLAAHGRSILSRVAGLTTIVELGPGNGQKLVALVEAGRLASGRLDFRLVDISADALATSRRALGVLPNVDIFTYQTSYEAGLGAAARETTGRALVLFLGSNIGNFDRPGADAFLRGVRSALARGDAFLMGADLVKSERELLLAYDDPLGVTAAFNRNLLVRINRELDADFDIGQFAHRAVWNQSESRVEMHLTARRRQRVRIPAADLDLVVERGESIWTESSYKYRPEEIVQMLERAGFRRAEHWIDDNDGFALTLVEAV